MDTDLFNWKEPDKVEKFLNSVIKTLSIPLENSRLVKQEGGSIR